jgi:HPt (histidine-containing phosphotransfer) domain-containing protein
VSDFSSEFIEEAREKLECFRNIILELEQSGVRAELLNEAFRAIHTVKGSGAMVGFSHLAESIHTLETEFDALRKGGVNTISQEEIDRFLRWSDFVETYLNGLARDRSFILSPGELIEHQQADVTRLEELRKARVTPISERINAATQIYPVHYRSYLVSGRAVSEEISWSLLALSALGLPDAQPEKFAETALDILRNQCNLPDIERVCFVRRIGLSNQYESVSAFSLHRNMMQRGTRCYVHPESSLTRIGPGYVRVLHIPHAIRHYDENHRRPQRVVKTLSETGCKSGLCLGVGTRRHNLGYLFVNATSNLLLNLPRHTLPLFSELAKYAGQHIREMPCPEPLYFQIFGDSHEQVHGERLLAERIEANYHRVALVFGSAPLTISNRTGQLPPALISHGNIGYILARLGSVRGVDRLELSIFTDHRRIVFQCRIEGDQAGFHVDYVDAAKAVAQAPGYDMEHPVPDTVHYTTIFDPCLDQHTKYSA